MSKKNVLHVGSGCEHILGTHGFDPEDWNEIRLDVEAGVEPDIVASMTDLRGIPDGGVDVIFSSHNLEHLEQAELPLALGEFLRVLKADGYLVATMPDLQSVCLLVAQDRLDDPAYNSPAGPITPLDILYGHRPSLARGLRHMAHRTGFTRKTLQKTLAAAGFVSMAIHRARDLALYAVASPRKRSQAELLDIFLRHWRGSAGIR